ncbi:MAG: PAS domain-containing protein [Thiobacillaceae bacterium]
MNCAAQHAANDESPLRLHSPVSANPARALQCTIWLDGHGCIQDSDGPVEPMFGYWFEKLRDQHISLLLPDLAHADLLTQDRINPVLLQRCHGSTPFRGVSSDGQQRNYTVLMTLIANQLGQRLSMTLRDHVP